MSEKRFEFYSDENLVGVIDTVTGRTFNSFEIVDCLNKLIEENEQLKEAKYEYKQDWKQASVNCDLYKQEINFLKDEIKGFEEENEQLKQKLEILALNGKKNDSIKMIDGKVFIRM